MARPIAGATISFGLVSIPVRLYPATQSSAAISFNLLHKKCGSRLKQQYICPRDNETVNRDDMVKGYEFAKDQYVTFTAEELKALEEKATQSIDIDSFVPLSAIASRAALIRLVRVESETIRPPQTPAIRSSLLTTRSRLSIK